MLKNKHILFIGNFLIVSRQVFLVYLIQHDKGFIYPLYRTSRGIPEYPILKRMGQVATITLQTLEQR